MSDGVLEKTLEHYRKGIEDLLREYEQFKAIYAPRSVPYGVLAQEYTGFTCIKCFNRCTPSETNLCGKCWNVGDKVKDNSSTEEFTVVKLYTMHDGKYGTMTGVRASDGSYYEYFNSALRLA